MFDFISIGDTTLDVFLIVHEYRVMFDIKRENKYLCVNYADKVPVDKIEQLVAGNASNAAVAAARAGLKTAIVSQMGDDETSLMALKEFEQEKIALDYFRREKNTKSNYSTVIAVDGERTILIYHTERKYKLPKMQSAKWVYLTSMSHGSEKIFPALVKYLQRTQAKLVYQPGTFQLRLGPKLAQKILEYTELFVVNKEEAIKYTNSEPEIEIKKLLDKVTKLGPEIVVITNGTKGSYCYDGNIYWKMGILKEIPRIESTGAGDAYASGIAVALSHGKTIPEAMRWGHFNSSSVIQFIGPHRGLLTHQQYEAWSKKYAWFKPEKMK